MQRLDFARPACTDPQMDDGFDWDGLRSFLAVARAGRLTVAADRAGVDHSTLSRRIGRLEAGLGVRLFDRRVSGYALTAAGETLMRTAEAMESLLDDAAASLSDTRLTIAGQVRIGAPEGFGTRFLAPLLGELAAAHPAIELQLVTLPRMVSLSRREADLAIGLARPVEGRLKARKLVDYELGLYASRAYLDGAGGVASIADLRRHRFIGYISDLIYAPELDYLKLIAPSLPTAFTSSSVLAQEQATLAGHGLCVLPCFLSGGDGRLVRVLPDAVSLIRSFWLIVHADAAERAAVRTVSEFIATGVARRADRFVSAA